MTPPRLLLRADAGHGLGSGHVMRLTALADAAATRGGRAVMMVGGEPGPILDQLVARRIDAVAAASGDGDVAAVIARARDLHTDHIVVDGPSFTPAYVATLTAAGLRVTSLDDLGTTPLPTHAVLNHNLGAEELADRYPAAALRMLGRRFHLLRREFRVLPAAGPALRPQARRVLITMGGSDPAGATARVVGAIRGPALELVVVLGPGFRCDDTLARALAVADARGHGIELHYRPLHLPAIMESCDVAISAAGGTLAELGYLGRPTFAIAIVPDQIANARRHVMHELAVGGHRLQDLSDGELADGVSALLASHTLRRRLRAASAFALDGKGAERVLEHLAA